MIAEELINQMITPLKLTDSVQKALHWMEDLRIKQLPVIDNGEYKGLVTEDVLLLQPDNKISDIPLMAEHVVALPHQHFYDAVKIAEENKLSMVVVVDEHKHYLGAIVVHDTLAAFILAYTMQEPGGVLVFSMDQRDYSLTEISRLVESNDAKILSVYVATDKEDPHKVKVTIKLNRLDIVRIVATFERFDYKIIAKIQATESYNVNQDRLEMFLKYLDI